MFKKLPDGVNLTMICDSFHSGSMSRSIDNPNGNRVKFLAPPIDIRHRSFGKQLPKSKIGKKQGDRNKFQRHVLLSGCKDDQTSADAHIGGQYQGAFTWALTKAVKDNPNCTFRQAHREALKLIKLRKYAQTPQISGSAELLERPIFGGTK